ncbi:hypothetical protein [Nodosilinea sp. FACHB-13]|uniref:hypothetical protein n=1 Tax=Cyanophyceae TaxID=3028117 RepID=UPI0016876727|nr:hypothetical protein [Nodosilinea sp. FACHB-13]MBD2109751.1 hypothetical protein [Nodosilinea sp. FACHB-13]
MSTITTTVKLSDRGAPPPLQRLHRKVEAEQAARTFLRGGLAILVEGNGHMEGQGKGSPLPKGPHHWVSG